MGEALKPDELETFRRLTERQVRNPTEGGHGFRRKADSNPIIADSG
jgi:hypothetical protein